ncbi:hypothetical protein ACT89R_01870 [Rhodococcus qingshengii]
MPNSTTHESNRNSRIDPPIARVVAAESYSRKPRRQKLDDPIAASIMILIRAGLLTLDFMSAKPADVDQKAEASARDRHPAGKALLRNITEVTLTRSNVWPILLHFPTNGGFAARLSTDEAHTLIDQLNDKIRENAANGFQGDPNSPHE